MSVLSLTCDVKEKTSIQISTLIVKNIVSSITAKIFGLAFLGFIFCSASAVSAQSGAQNTGKISGKVLDSRTGELIIGGNVAIEGTTKGAATDIDGRFSIAGLDPGSYTLIISFISYSKKRVTDVIVESGESTSLDISLVPQTVDMEEVTVTAGAVSNSEAGLLAIQRKAVAFQDGLSSEFLSKSGDGNVASAMKRVTGVTLMNGKDVFVRGLGNRYSNVQTNGALVLSTSPTKKEVPVDLINSGSADNIVVQKNFTSDQSGEF
jgi:uncharacterized alkaline shock family protein YloU